MRKRLSDTPDEGLGFTRGDARAALMDLTPDLVFVIDSDMRVVFVNPAAERFLGRSEAQARGLRVADLFGPLGTRFETRLSEAAAQGRLLEFEDKVSSGDREMWQRTTLVPITHPERGVVLGVARDITDSKRLEVELREHAQEVEDLATHDALTGIENRRAFVAGLERALALCRRGTCSMVLFMDVDEFKRCNDERGHAFGDDILMSVAGLLKKEAREVDLVARIGGDEFAAVLVDATEDGASEVAKRMRASVEALGDDIGIPIGLSIGIVRVEQDGNVDDVMSTADHRMYEHKARRRGLRKTATTA
jgi:diguanylate cyclase (GGDEF)-like protein/PAS domain S-box-containing protein